MTLSIFHVNLKYKYISNYNNYENINKESLWKYPLHQEEITFNIYFLAYMPIAIQIERKDVLTLSNKINDKKKNKRIIVLETAMKILP